ncbi:DUF6270 domain-containing protein [uncultured Phenylobacterium sp.]|uniref:DUF6270 domain-containing protein n=1 Tax=uncultured Phenylobacterium sp. TaxID=349273 RepID=UPI0025FEAD3C|nr:DUF6270 domain-containing protein [uncultured Phenylobacterium sp.]
MPTTAPRIAIVGSCITRDLWPIHGGGSEAVLYISRTGLPSLLAAPVPGLRTARTPPGDLRRHEHNALVADLEKTALARLVAFEPTHIIFDFIDERFDLLAAAGWLATHSAELERSGYRAQPVLSSARTVPRLSGACERLWRQAAGEFAALVRATQLGRAELILHAARWASDQRLPDGRVVPVVGVDILTGVPAEIAAYNALLQRQEDTFAALMPPMARIEAVGQRLADPAHQWGLSPFHYVPEYYAEIRRQLAALGLAEVFSAPAAAPSAPAG